MAIMDKMRRPFEDMRNRPASGPYVQNMGGLAPNTAPLASRPVSAPGVRLNPPGPQLMGGGGGGLTPLAGRPAGGPIVTPSAQQARSRSSARNASSARDVSKFSSQQYGRSGGANAPEGSLEGQIRGALGGMFSGQTSRGFVDRARGALGSAVEGQRAQAVRRIDDDAIRRGLFRSGIPAEQTAAAGNAAQGAFSQGLADILSQAEGQDIQGRQFATGQASNLLGMNRSFDAQMQNRIEAARRRGGGGPGTTTIIDPDTGQSYEVDQSLMRFL